MKLVYRVKWEQLLMNCIWIMLSHEILASSLLFIFFLFDLTCLIYNVSCHQGILIDGWWILALLVLMIFWVISSDQITVTSASFSFQLPPSPFLELLELVPIALVVIIVVVPLTLGNWKNHKQNKIDSKNPPNHFIFRQFAILQMHKRSGTEEQCANVAQLSRSHESTHTRLTRGDKNTVLMDYKYTYLQFTWHTQRSR